LTIDRPYSYKLRKAVKTGEAEIKTGETKLLYKYDIYASIPDKKQEVGKNG